MKLSFACFVRYTNYADIDQKYKVNQRGKLKTIIVLAVPFPFLTIYNPHLPSNVTIVTKNRNVSCLF